MKRGAKSGYQTNSDVVRIPAQLAAAHTILVAQSGAGKSFFLGRLIEEIAANTLSNFLILDPNSDFRKLFNLDTADSWKSASYDPVKKLGKLHTEKSRAEFDKEWKKVSIRIRTARIPLILRRNGQVRTDSDGNPVIDEHYDNLRFWWPSISADILGGDTNSLMRTELHHCHVFAQKVIEAQEYQREIEGRRYIIGKRGVATAEELYGKIQQFRGVAGYEEAARGIISNYLELPTRRQKPEEPLRISLRGRRFVDEILSSVKYFSPGAANFYFGLYEEYRTQAIITNSRPKIETDRIKVIDLPSLSDRRTQFMVVYSRLALEWESARRKWQEKVDDNPVSLQPTFIVVDEAHNLIPEEPEDRSERVLRELFKTIAAEGRKYGLFLMLATQRPDKLDSSIISECENKAVMRLDASSLKKVGQTFGIEGKDFEVLQQVTTFGTGKVLILGRWANWSPLVFYSAARRTTEGGANILPEDWAIHPK